MAYHWSQTRSLAKLVARTFAMADLPPEVRQISRIDKPDLPWRVPPLMPSMSLGGEPLETYFDAALTFTPADLHNFWKKALHDTWHQPGLSFREGTYNGLRGMMRHAKLGSRIFRFSLPEGYPGQLDEKTGGMLSLEVAHAVFISHPVVKRVFDISNYWVQTADGLRFGVEDGRPILESPWEYDATAEVLDLLESPRGAETSECMFDQIAAMRSIVHTHKDAFRKAFAGLDMALQALRYLSWGGYCPELITENQVAPIDIPMLKLREQAVREAREGMDSNRINDKQKLETVYFLLVPNVLSATRFRRYIYGTEHFPYSLSLDKETRIKEYLREYYELEIPQNLRRM